MVRLFDLTILILLEHFVSVSSVVSLVEYTRCFSASILNFTDDVDEAISQIVRILSKGKPVLLA